MLVLFVPLGFHLGLPLVNPCELDIERMMKALNSFEIQCYKSMADFLKENPNFFDAFENFFLMHAFDLLKEIEFEIRNSFTLEEYQELMTDTNVQLATIVAQQKIESFIANHDYKSLLDIPARFNTKKDFEGWIKVKNFFVEQQKRLLKFQKAEADAKAEAEAEADANKMEFIFQASLKKLQNTMGGVPKHSGESLVSCVPSQKTCLECDDETPVPEPVPYD